MTTYLSSPSAGTLVPALVTTYESTRQTGNIVHTVLGSSSPDVTLKDAGTRTGTLNILVLSHADALAMEAFHADSGVLTLTDSDLPGLNMNYVASGAITLSLEDDTRQLWTVAVDFTELV